MKKILALVLVAVFILVGLAACGDDKNDQSKDQSTQSHASQDTTSQTQSDISDETSTDPYSHLRGFNLDEREIKILVYGDYRDRYKSVEIMYHDSNPEVINTAIETRNQIVEELLNCKLTESGWTTCLPTPVPTPMVDSQYDIIMPYMPAAATCSGRLSV